MKLKNRLRSRRRGAFDFVGLAGVATARLACVCEEGDFGERAEGLRALCEAWLSVRFNGLD